MKVLKNLILLFLTKLSMNKECLEPCATCVEGYSNLCSTCNSRSYMNEEGDCISCGDYCENCTEGPNKCIKCHHYYIPVDGICTLATDVIPDCLYGNGLALPNHQCTRCTNNRFGVVNGECLPCTPERDCLTCNNDVDSCSSCYNDRDFLTYPNGTKYCASCTPTGGSGCYRCDSIGGLGCTTCHWRNNKVFDPVLGYNKCVPCQLANCINCIGDQGETCTRCYFDSSNLKAYYLDTDIDGNQICRPSCDREFQFTKPSRALVIETNSCELCQDPNCKKCLNDTLICEVCQPTHYMKNDLCTMICLETEGLMEIENKCYPCNVKSIENCGKCTNDTFICQGCLPGFEFIQSENFCKRICKGDEGYIRQGNQCQKCNTKTEFCTSCKDESLDCLGCEVGYKALTTESYCKKECLGDEGHQRTGNVCTKCNTVDSRCLKCEDETLQCLECVSGYEAKSLPRNYCKKVCQLNEGYVYEQNDCFLCNTRLDNCVGCDDNFQCSSCLPGFTALALPENLCKMNCGVDEGYQKSTNTCPKCSSKLGNCVRCEGENSNFQCLECVPGFTALAPPENLCKMNCGVDEGYQKSTNSCPKCSSKLKNCVRCEDENFQCLECIPGFTALLRPENLCKLDCKEDEGYQKSTNTCPKCSSKLENCVRCEDENFQCLECLPGFTPLQKPNNLCRKNCQPDEGYITQINNCKKCSLQVEHCTRCTDDTFKCTFCEAGYRAVPQGDFCWKNCEIDEAYISKINNCEKCSNKVKNCFRCYDENFQCYACKENFFLHPDGSCVSECPEGMGGFQGRCFYCQTPNCKKCFKDEKKNFEEICSSCYEENYFLNETKKCQKKCPDGEAWIEPNDCQRCSPCHFCYNKTLECIRKNINFSVEKLQPQYPVKDMKILLKLKYEDYIFDEKDFEKIMEKLEAISKVYYYTNSTEATNDDEQNRILAQKRYTGVDFRLIQISKNQSNSLETILDFKQSLSREDYNLTVSLNSPSFFNKKLDLFFVLNSENFTIIKNGFTKAESDAMGASKSLENNKKTTEAASEAVGSVASILSPGISGPFYELLQVLKLVDKFRFLNVEYGRQLKSFLGNFGNNETHFITDETINIEYGKITKEGFDYRLKKIQRVKMVFFLLLFSLRFLCYFFKEKMHEKKKASKPMIYFIVFRNKFEFIALNSSLLESFTPVVQISLRTRNLREDINFFDSTLSSLYLMAMVYSTLEIVVISLSKEYSRKLENLVRIEYKRGGKKNGQNVNKISQAKNKKPNNDQESALDLNVSSSKDEKQLKNGYTEYSKKINHKITLENLKFNRNSFAFSIHDLEIKKLTNENYKTKEELEKVMNSGIFRLTSVLFTVRLLFYHFFICTSQQFATLNIMLLIVVELILLACYITKLLKFWKFSQRLQIMSKMVQSFATGSFLFICIYLRFNSDKFYKEKKEKDIYNIEKYEPPSSIQNTGILIFKINILAEYAFIGLIFLNKILFVTYNFYRGRKVIIEFNKAITYYTLEEEKNYLQDKKFSRKKKRELVRKELEERKRMKEVIMSRNRELEINMQVENHLKMYKQEGDGDNWLNDLERHKDVLGQGMMSKFTLDKIKQKKEKVLDQLKMKKKFEERKKRRDKEINQKKENKVLKSNGGSLKKKKTQVFGQKEVESDEKKNKGFLKKRRRRKSEKSKKRNSVINEVDSEHEEDLKF